MLHPFIFKKHNALFPEPGALGGPTLFLMGHTRHGCRCATVWSAEPERWPNWPPKTDTKTGPRLSHRSPCAKQWQTQWSALSSRGDFPAWHWWASSRGIPPSSPSLTAGSRRRSPLLPTRTWTASVHCGFCCCLCLGSLHPPATMTVFSQAQTGQIDFRAEAPVPPPSPALHARAEHWAEARQRSGDSNCWGSSGRAGRKELPTYPYPNHQNPIDLT